MVQTGDPGGTGKGGQSIWGGGFADEIRQTLKVGGWVCGCCFGFGFGSPDGLGIVWSSSPSVSESLITVV